MKRLVAAVLVLVPISVFSAPPRKSDRIVRFVVRVENVSTPRTLKLSTGDTAPAPHSPVVWAVHRYPGIFFTLGHFDHGVGLEALAEDGNPQPLAQHLAA